MTKTYTFHTDCGNCGEANRYEIPNGLTITDFFSISVTHKIRKCKRCKCDVDPNGVL